MPTTTDTKPHDEVDVTLKEWAQQIAADAPPLSDDQYHQLHAILVGGATRGVRRAPRTKQAAA